MASKPSHSDWGLRGGYDYYVCGRHLRYGECQHSARIREDELVEFVKGGFARAFDRVDEMVSAATEIATAAMRSERSEASRLKTELATLETEQARLVELLMDKTIADASKQAARGWRAEPN